MSQSALDASYATALDSCDFDQNYRCLKNLIQDLKAQNGTSAKKALFGEDRKSRALTKKQMKDLARFLRKIENRYDECTKETAPIPEELETAIRERDSDEWLPWELEAIEKVESWREDLEHKRQAARTMLRSALQKIRDGVELDH